MKKRSIFAGLILAFFSAAAQGQDDPGRVQTPESAVAAQSITGGAQPLFQPANTPITQTPAAIAEAITPDIQTLAGNLGYDPTRIFNYVHDQIRYVHYFGSKKGAELTLLERSGNDFDQCALLSALLQASGYAPTYQFGVMELPYDNPTNHQDLHHWLALNIINTNFSVNTSNFFTHFFSERGNYNWSLAGTNTIAFQRVWVALTLSGTNYYLDPSFKVSEPVAGASIGAAMGYNSNTLWTAAGGTDTGNSVSNLNEGLLRGTLQSCNSNLLNYLSNNMPDASVAQVVGGQQIVSSVGSPLMTSLLFPVYTNSPFPLTNWTTLPTNFMGTFSVSFAGSNQTWLTPQLAGQRISLTFSNNGVAQLWVEDTPVLQVNHPSSSNTVNVVFTATHPYGYWDFTNNLPVDGGVTYGFDRSFTNSYQTTNASYVVTYGFEPNQAWLQKRQQTLNAYLAAGYTNGSRQVTCETLNVMGLGWMVQTELAGELLAQEGGQLHQNHHRFGRMAQELGRGYYIDVYLELDGTLPSTGYNAPDILACNEVFDVVAYFSSAMEHGIIEQLQSSNLVAASTVKMIEIASTNSQSIYLANSGNWTTVRNNLVHYGANTNTLNNLIAAGYTLLLPQNGSNSVNGSGSWAGESYVELGTNSGGRVLGMAIGGGYNGGYDSSPTATIDTPFVSQSATSLPTFYNPQSATQPVPPQVGADPVNLADGTFQITSTDLSVGQSEPRGLNLTRYYTSERINANPSGMAPGWLHSYYCNAKALSDPEAGLGGATVEQMSPMIVATYTALNFYNNVTPDPKNWTTVALIAKWGIDQLINNAVSVNLGNSTLEFARQPDGSYTPPANSTMSLSQSGGAFVLQERHGRTFDFNTNSVLTNIVDQYGQSMKLSYNSNNLVTNVTDWVNRSLTFHYTNGTLTSVSDSTGRSVSYGYTNGELTSYTDPEQKSTTYAYDSSNELVATFDALNNLVESNYYDGYGHVTLQLTAGQTNKAWQIAASGFQTIEVDPAGDTLVYTYDNKSRLVSFQDGMGNVTQTVYDGQDHVAQTISPLNETSQMFYDSSNNLIETIDPLGFSNVFMYDANNNLIAQIDGDNHTNHFGYNSQFSLTASTNGNGDGFALAYHTDGTLQSRTDAGGTTGYTFGDTYKQLTSISYPTGFGSETFANDALGDVTNHLDARGITNTLAYNKRRQLTNAIVVGISTNNFAFDQNANQLSATDGRGFATTNTWSVTRKLIATSFPTTPQGTPVITNGYDSRDWLASTANPLGKTTYYTDDAAQRLIAAADPLQRTNQIAYDPDGHATNASDAASEHTIQAWDARGNLVRTTDAATNTVGKAYDGAGNLIYLTNRNGKLWHFQYDGANRLTNTVSPTGKTTGQIYNNRGLLQSVKDAMTQTTTLSWNARGWLTNRTDNVGTTAYQQDLDGNITNVSQGAQTIQQQFDSRNRLTNYTDANGYIIQYRWDANGNLTNLIYPGGLSVKYYYDSNNRLTNLSDWSGRQTSYAYDLAGHLTSITRPNNTLRSMSYDADGELTNIVEKTTTQFPIGFQTLHYNLAGRIDWEFKAPLPHTNTPSTRTMAYDDDNRLATFNGSSVTMDNDGNMTYGPGTNNTFGTYTYDARNELTSAGGLSYGYDPAGNRTKLTNGAAITTFVVNPQGSQVLMRINAGRTNYYIYGVGLDYEIDVTGSTVTTAYYHFDCRGSAVTLTDGSGNPTDIIEYSAYGSTTYRYGTNDTSFLYNGQFGVQTDPNGLLYMRARYYNPYITRFVNADPSGFNGGLNFYAFCNDNPINAEDPFGLSGQVSIGIAGTIGGSPILISPGPFVGGGVSVGFTTGGQLFVQFQGAGMVGVGAFGGVGVQGSYSSSASPIAVGYSTSSTALHGELNAGWEAAVGLSGDLASDGRGLSSSLPMVDIGAGYGVMVGVGASTTTTFASPSIVQMGDSLVRTLNSVFPPLQGSQYLPVILQNAPPNITVTSQFPAGSIPAAPASWLGQSIQGSATGKH
jgi:RHS repeat-associated protein